VPALILLLITKNVVVVTKDTLEKKDSLLAVVAF
jgi:hypothetical protein